MADDLRQQIANIEGPVSEWDSHEIQEKPNQLPESAQTGGSSGQTTATVEGLGSISTNQPTQESFAVAEWNGRVREAVSKEPPLARFEALDRPSEYERGWAAAMAEVERALVSEEQTGPTTTEDSDHA